MPPVTPQPPPENTLPPPPHAAAAAAPSSPPDEVLRRRRSEDLFLATEPPRFTGDDTGPGGGGLHTGPTHWSIGWSDLMMTMCMLFLILYVQQTTQRNFLRDTGEEVVAGSEIELRHTPENAVPLAPISPQISDRPGDTLKRVEPERKTVQELDELLMQQPGPTKTAATPAAKSVVELADATTLAELDELRKTIRGGSQRPIEQLPRPLGAGHSATPGSLADIYTMSHHALAGESRHQQAMVELEPDKAVHIILTADLLFPAGSTELSEQARTVLRKVAGIIRNTPNQIHIEGHSDSQPPRARQSSTNLEVSLARASRVARVFIDEMGIQASRIVVAGHADNRPRQPNSDEVGRAANRRVELIISRESPPGTPEPPNPTTSG